AVENVELPLLLTDLGRGARHERALVALRAVGLPHRADHRPQQLSGGEQQRVAIARAIVNDPDPLVADGPTGAVDARSAEGILPVRRELNRTFEKTIVMVTHDPRAERWVDTAVRLDKGILVDDGGVGTAAGGAHGPYRPRRGQPRAPSPGRRVNDIGDRAVAL